MMASLGSWLILTRVKGKVQCNFTMAGFEIKTVAHFPFHISAFHDQGGNRERAMLFIELEALRLS
jgi:hypothetical protein